MQQFVYANLETAFSKYRRLNRSFFITLTVIGTVIISGCADDAKQTPQSTKPFAGVSLNFHCPDKAFADALSPAARSWAERVGAEIKIQLEPMTAGDNADIGVIEVPDFGIWADRGELTPVPQSFKAPDNPYQWTGLLPAYQEQLITWGGQARALPLAGDGYVIVYRADRLKDSKFIAAFQAQVGRSPTEPRTWEDFGTIAEVFTALDGKPSLPPFTNSELATLFFRIAACRDKLVQRETTQVKLGGGLEALSFQFNLINGNPRLNEPAFVDTARWLGDLVAKKCLPPPLPGISSDPASVLAKNDASIAVMSLSQLARFPRENGAIPERFGIAAVPGTRSTFDPEKRRVVTLSAQSSNYIPYFSGGKLGVVRSRCASPAAAFDLLAELGGPTRSLEIIASAGLGAGPFRTSHFDREKILIWYGYGFEAGRSDQLRNAMLQYVHLEAKNPTCGLRGPDQTDLYSVAENALGRIASGKPAEAEVMQLQSDWKQIDLKTPDDKRLRWRKNAAGLN
jgi:multiple sugar transport system substrate-binding protein